MELSYELISQFAKQIVNKDKKTSKESTVYGTVRVDANGNKYVMLDGSDQLTPLTDDERPSVDVTTTNANDGDRVSVLIKNHTATVTGNISSPSARTDDVEKIADDVSDIQEFDIMIGKQVQADKAYFQKLLGDDAVLGKLEASEASILELLASNAEIENLLANKIKVTDLIAAKIDADLVVADKAILDSLKATNADILSLIAEKAVIDRLVAEKATLQTLMAQEANLKFANIDFANIGEAAFNRLFSDTGLIESLVVGEQSVTGRLVGVTIKGDIIEGGTIIADKLVVLGDDGLYYKLNTNGVTTEAEQTEYNSLNGSVITAKSITAEKVNVNDLVAFGATIGGFNINDHAIYSGVKSSVDNSTRGTYLSADGQFNIGDETRFIKYYHVSMASAYMSDDKLIVRETSSGSVSTDISDGVVHFTDASQSMDVDASLINGSFSLKVGAYKLEISAESILFGGGAKKSLADLEALTEHVKIGTTVDPETNEVNPCVELSEGDSDFRQVITNKASRIMEGENVITEMDTDGVTTENMTVRNEIRQGQWAWVQHGRGNLGLMWKEVVN